MKRTVCFCLLMLLCVSCFSCGVRGGSPSDTTAAPDTQETAAPDGYKQVECREAQSYRTAYCGMEGSNTVLPLRVPEDWTFSGNRSGLNCGILRGGEQIGRIYPAEKMLEHGTDCVAHTEDRLIAGASVERCILRCRDDAGSGYLHRLQFLYSDEFGNQNLVLEVDYAELSEYALAKLSFSGEPVLMSNGTGIGALSQFRSLYRPGILILGNSFVNTSAIGGTLQEMIDNGSAPGTVDAISIGYATVKGYVNNYPEYLNRISGREYGVVLMCGFYSHADADAFQKVVERCRETGTLLAIFPAHNESESAIRAARSKWKDEAVFLDWRGELDNLIRYGKVSRSQFCMQDQHSHSTPLAGFVGAHMIYRALFGEIPPEIGSGSMTTAKAYRVLGEYVNTGRIESVAEKNVTRFYNFPADWAK